MEFNDILKDFVNWIIIPMIGLVVIILIVYFYEKKEGRYVKKNRCLQKDRRRRDQS